MDQSRLRPFVSIFNYVENADISYIHFILTGLFSIVLRYFFESFSQYSLDYFNLGSEAFLLNLLHEILFYFLIAVIFIITLHFATRESIASISKVVMSGLILLIVGPLLDIMFSGGAGYNMYYFVPGSKDLIRNFFTYSLFHPGATPGIKIETLIIFFTSFCYLQYKGKHGLISLGYVIVLYAFVFLLSATPSVLMTIISWLGFEYHFSNILLINYFSLLLLLGFLWMFWLAEQRLMSTLLMDCRFARILYYLMTLLFGVMIGFAQARQPYSAILYANPEILMDFVFSIICIFFAGIFVIITNNMADLAIDTISNPHRPLVQKRVDVLIYELAGYISFGISLYYSLLAGAKTFFLILFVSGIYYLYSMPPLRYKRVILVSKLTVSLASLALVVMGYLIAGGKMAGFPKSIYPIFLIGITLCANMIDIKDKDGDAAAGIKTLPVVLGLTNAKRIIGVSFILTYLSFYFLLANFFATLVFFMLGIVQYYLLNKAQYEEWKILALNTVSFLMLIITYAFLAG